MQNWKRAVVAGSAAAAAIMFVKRKNAAGVLLAGIGLVTLATEYPEKFAEVRRRLPEYLERGTAVVNLAGQLGERFAQNAERSGSHWLEAILGH
jgi:hypothetical protein